MNRILSDAYSFGIQYLRTKVGAFFSFIFPLILILLFGAVFSGGGEGGISLPVQNMDQGQFSDILLDVLNGTGYFDISMIDRGEEITQYINDNSLTLALYVPSNFSANIGASTQAPVTLYGDMSKASFQVAQGVLNAAITQLNYNLSGGIGLVSLDVQNAGSEKLSAYDFYLPGFVGLTVMISSMYFMTSMCAEYRGRGYFKLLATTLMRKSDWLVSKFIFNSVLLIASLLVTFGFAALLFDLEAVLTPMSFVLVVGGAFLFTSLGMLLGSIVKDPESGSAVSNAIGFPMMFLSGSFWDLNFMPQYMQIIAKVMPLTYLNDGLRDTMIYGNETSALMNLAVVAVLGLVFFALASRLMSWKEK